MKILRLTPLAILLAVVLGMVASRSFGQNTQPIRNVVLVHGAFVDGSGWQGVYDLLTRQGYRVSVTQHALLSFEDDVKAVNRIIEQQDGPCILVAHSYGGAVITKAGHHPRVSALVYLAAHAPDAGESEADNGKKYPAAYKSLIKGTDGLDYIDPAKFPDDFAGGVPAQQARFMAVSQPPTADSIFHAIIQNPAWKTKPVWYMVAKADKIINPDLERFYAKRANARKTVEIDGASHCVFMTHPQEAADLIMAASKGSN